MVHNHQHPSRSRCSAFLFVIASGLIVTAILSALPNSAASLSSKPGGTAVSSARVETRDGVIKRHSLNEPALNPSEEISHDTLAKSTRDYANLPLSFEINRGQTDQQVKFLARGPGYGLFLTSSGAVLSLDKFASMRADSDSLGETLNALPSEHPAVVSLRLHGANPAAEISGVDHLPGKVNYFIGKDPQNWRTDIETYSKVRQCNVYRGIDLVYYGNQQQLEYDFVVAPKANPRRIKLSFTGVKKIRTNRNGDLILSTSAGELVQQKAIAYQEKNGKRREVSAAYRIKGATVSFSLGRYDKTEPLIIDPVLVYSSFLGGGQGETGLGIAVDAQGHAFLTGSSGSMDFPTAGAMQPANAGQNDAFVLKLNPAGSALVYSTYIGGDGFDTANAISIDAQGNAYVTGTTSLGDFPVTPGAFQTTRAGGIEAFVTKLNSSGSALSYSTYLSGANSENGLSIAVSADGRAHVVGRTDSTNFGPIPLERRGSPVYKSNDNAANWSVSAVDLTASGVTSFAIDPVNSNVIYAGTPVGVFKSTNAGSNWTLAGSPSTSPQSVVSLVVDPSNPNIVYAGSTDGVYKTSDGGQLWELKNIAFIVAPNLSLAIDPVTPTTIYAGNLISIFKSTNSGETWVQVSSGLGGPLRVNAIAIDPTNSSTIYIATSRGIYKTSNGAGSWSPINGGFPPFSFFPIGTLAIDPLNTQTVYAASSGLGVYKTINGGMLWTPVGDIPSSVTINALTIDRVNPSTLYLGTTGEGIYKSINSGANWVQSNSGLANLFVLAIAIDPNNTAIVYAGTAPGADAFWVKLNPSGSSLEQARTFGGNENDEARGIVLDAADIPYIVGSTNSLNFPVLNAFQASFGGVTDAFVVKLDAAGSGFTYSTYLGGNLNDQGRAIAVRQSSAYVVGQTMSTDFPVVSAFQPATITSFTSDAFISKFNPVGSTLEFSSYLGGSNTDQAFGVALDSNGSIFITGLTNSLNFPTLNPTQAALGGIGIVSNDAFVTKLNPSGTTIAYSTYLGGTNPDQGNGIAVDSLGDAYVVGTTSSTNFPTVNPLQATVRAADAFATKIALAADLTITNEDSRDPVMVGNNLTYTLTVRNSGPDSAANIVLTDALPAGVGFVSATPSQGSCFGTTLVTCNLGSLAKDASATVSIVVTPPSVVTITNTVTVTSATFDPNSSNNSATQETRVSALPSIAGRVASSAAVATPGVMMSLTGSQAATTASNPNGFYQFPDLTSGGNFTVMPSRQGFVFHPQSRSFTNLTADATADFQSVECNFSITPRNQSFTSSGGNGSVTITAPDSLCPWTASSDVPWITITSAPTGFGSGPVNFIVAPTTTSRSGTLRIANNVFTVWQEFSPCGMPSFQETPRFPAGAFPWIAARGDFNNDGNVDVALINEGIAQPAKVSVIIGNGAGGFGAPISVNTSGTPQNIAVADFNNDGNLDAVVVLFGQSNNIEIFLGDGAGNLASFGVFTAGGLPAHAAVGDFNKDGKADLAVANEDSHNVSIMLGTGTGAFGAATQIGANVGHAAKRVVIGDFNHDNKQDLVVLGTFMPLIMGNGDGTFAPPVVIQGLRLGAVVVGDFNKDGHEDLAGTTPSNDGPLLSVSLNNGFGGFGIPISSAMGGREPGRLVVADFNGDGNPDLGSGNNPPFGSTNDVNVFLGNGAGSFTPGPAYITGLGVRDIVVADFNSDGKQDIVATTAGSVTPPIGEAAFLAGTGSGGFLGARSFIAPGITQDIVSLDFNGDSRLDLLVLSTQGAALLPGTAPGEFGPPISLASFTPANSDYVTRSFSVKDFNHDGKPDLGVKVYQQSDFIGRVRVYLNNGAGGLTLAGETELETFNQSVLFADFNGDGNPDLIAMNSSVLMTIRLGNGAGGFAAPTVISPQLNASRLESGDFNGDGKLDLALSTGSGYCFPPSQLFILFGDGSGNFSAPNAVPYSGFVGNMLASDLNGDGRSDLIVANTCAKKLNVLLANPSGGLVPGPEFLGGDGPRKLALADLNGDGKPDLIVTNDNNLSGVNTLSVLIGDGGGGFSGMTSLRTGFSVASVGVGDFDNNGRADLAVSDPTGSHVGVFINLCPAPSASLTATQYAAGESEARVLINVSRVGDSSGVATVNYTTSDTAGLTNCNVVNGIASSRCDYATSLGTIAFAAGETSKTISIPIVNDAYAEGNESFIISLSSSTGVSLGTPASATVTINDNETVNGTSPVDQTPFFVRQQYVDFLGREPDPAGGAAWEAVINNCPAGDTTCDRIHVSSAFFRSAEFQGRGYFIYRFYPVAFGRKPDYVEFIPDLAKVSGFLSDAQLEAAKVAFIAEFMTRPAFVTKYNGLNDTQYVDTLLATAQVTSPHRDFWIAALGNGTRTRATVLRDISESPEVYNKYYNQAFVVMQYFGYLRRDPDALYLDWIQVLETTGDFRGMVNGFMNSLEYRFRFGP